VLRRCTIGGLERGQIRAGVQLKARFGCVTAPQVIPVETLAGLVGNHSDDGVATRIVIRGPAKDRIPNDTLFQVVELSCRGPTHDITKELLTSPSS